ncbi:DNA polymerase [Ceratobasidium sp. AG-Ba]|nr:DNA polymerase [Ceratobasidium sp. AG-Ba]
MSSTSHRLSIEQWIAQVSSYMPAPLPNSTACGTSDDEVVEDNTRGHSSAQKRPLKRRADSSPIQESSRVIVKRRGATSRRATPYAASVTRSSTPAGSEFNQSEGDGRSDAGSMTTAAVTHRKKALIRRQANPPEIKLVQSIACNKASKSGAYAGYKEPVIDWTSGDPPTRHLFACLNCPRKVPRDVGDGGTSGLWQHRRQCDADRGQLTLLTQHGFTDSGELTEQSVREFVALWVSVNARPFKIVEDYYLRKLLHPSARHFLPHRNTIPKDIRRMYAATQASITSALKNVSGAMHIGLDMYQSDNGHDYLGIVLYHQVVERETIRIKRMVLECLSFGTRLHTGKRLARTTHQVLQKFEIEHRVWGAVGDGASTNEAMMKFMTQFGLKQLTGPDSRVYCLAHVLNLAAQTVAAPFRKRIARRTDDDDNDEDDEDEDGLDGGHNEDKHSDTSGGADPAIEDEDINPNDLDGEAGSWALDPDEDEDEDNQSVADFNEEVKDFDLPEIVPGSDEDDEAKSAAKVGRKLAWWGKKLRFSSTFKGIFVGYCIKLEVERPHNIRRDLKTRWNSTGLMSSDGERTFPAIMRTQRNSTVTIPPQYQFREEDLTHIKHLNMLFQAFTIVTEVALRAEVPMLADVIVHYDSLDYTYGKICNDTSLPLYVRHAANRARKVLNKYYTKTDTSHLYRLSILLHPGLRANYLRLAKWEEDWIETAILLAVSIYLKFYKLEDTSSSAPAQPTVISQFGYSAYGAHLFGANVTQDKPTPCLVREFVNGAIIRPTFDANHNPIFCNPIQWWYSQRVAGNDMNGLTQMALDVLTTPATSVDVERLFSFVGSTVSNRYLGMLCESGHGTTGLPDHSEDAQAREVSWPVKGVVA